MLLPLLGGCVAAAAVAVPALTALGAASQNQRKVAETPVPVPAPATAAVVVPGPRQTMEILPLTELPPPSGSSARTGVTASWQAFLSYALDRAETSADRSDTQSAILAPESAELLLPRQQPCRHEDKAVIVDLDRGESGFAPEADLQPWPGLAAGLSRLREAGIVVMWISALDANRVSEVAAALKSTGLDPTGRDPVLLMFGEDDRKQTLRMQAAKSACVVAIAGDEREDFDELFRYLRDPAAAGNFDEMIGSGWFLVPGALSTAADGVQPTG